ncbi:hypothetical protein G6F56_011582 [Rhizopus delemar]|nr:hypothetical protein G6F56_011582 [Rhizopus delemar]
MHPIATQGFQLSNDAYAQARPSYPLATIDFMTDFFTNRPKDTLQVLDIGAGTGIMTRLLVNQGFQVTAVEPVEGMLDKLRQSLPQANVLKGTSWSLPVPSGSQDFIVLAQCFHWFDDIPSLKEMYRVLKPGGYIFMVWNTEARDRSEWISKLAKLWEDYELAIPLHHNNNWQKVFETDQAKELYQLPLHHKQWFMDKPTTRSHLWTRVMSKSYVAILDDDKKRKLKQDFEQLLSEYQISQEEPFQFLDNTDLYWCHKK